jgi:hypothetical protein
VFYQFDVEGDVIFELDSRASQYDARKGYAGGILAPLYQQAFRWFREKHDAHHNIKVWGSVESWVFVRGMGIKWRPVTRSGYDNVTYEEAELECLKKLIEIVKEKQDE